MLTNDRLLCESIRCDHRANGVGTRRANTDFEKIKNAVHNEEPFFEYPSEAVCPGNRNGETYATDGSNSGTTARDSRPPCVPKCGAFPSVDQCFPIVTLNPGTVGKLFREHQRQQMGSLGESLLVPLIPVKSPENPIR